MRVATRPQAWQASLPGPDGALCHTGPHCIPEACWPWPQRGHPGRVQLGAQRCEPRVALDGSPPLRWTAMCAIARRCEVRINHDCLAVHADLRVQADLVEGAACGFERLQELTRELAPGCRQLASLSIPPQAAEAAAADIAHDLVPAASPVSPVSGLTTPAHSGCPFEPSPAVP